MRTTAKLASALVVGFGVATFASVCNATTYDFYSQSCNSGLMCGASGTLIANLTTTTDGSNVDITIHIDASGYYFFEAGNPPSVWFNSSSQPTGISGTIPVIGGSWVLYDPLGSTTKAPAGLGPMTGGVGYDKNNTIYNSDITLTLDGITAAAFAANTGGWTFILDLCHNTDTSSGSAGCGSSGSTGYIVDGGLVPTVPLPPAAMLFGSALVGLGILGRRRHRKNGLTQVA